MSREPRPLGPSPEGRLEETLNAFLAGALSPEERASLLRRLAEDPAARAVYGGMIEIEAMLHHEFPRHAEEAEAAPAIRRPKRVPWRPVFFQSKRASRALIAWGVAAALIIATWTWLWLSPAGRPVLETASGQWHELDARGNKRPLKVGDRLEQGGTLITEGLSAVATLRFPDDSTAVLTGQGELRISTEGRKQLSLRSGNLDVEMAPQPQERSALIRTDTAQVEVVGTRFTVDARSGSTAVAVSHGSVKLKRLADGETVEIRQDRIAIATLDATADLRPRPISTAAARWVGVADQLVIGTFSREEGDFKVAPFRAGGTDQGPVIHHGIAFQGTGSSQYTGLVNLTPESRVRVRYRVEDPRARLRTFIACRGAKGEFLGNRQAEFPAGDIPADADGWRVFDAPIRSFGALGGADFSIGGSTVTRFFVSVVEAADGLEVSSVEISG